MLNHRRKPNARWFYRAATGGFVLSASTFIPRGATIHDTYGQRSNQNYLKAYGFLFDGYPIPSNFVNVSGHRVNASESVLTVPGNRSANSSASHRGAMVPSAPEEQLLHNSVTMQLRTRTLLDVFAWSCDGQEVLWCTNSCTFNDSFPYERSRRPLIRSINDDAYNDEYDDDETEQTTPSHSFFRDHERSVRWFTWLMRDGLGGRGTSARVHPSKYSAGKLK